MQSGLQKLKGVLFLLKCISQSRYLNLIVGHNLIFDYTAAVADLILDQELGFQSVSVRHQSIDLVCQDSNLIVLEAKASAEGVV